jgi:hypothetical protein
MNAEITLQQVVQSKNPMSRLTAMIGAGVSLAELNKLIEIKPCT